MLLEIKKFYKILLKKKKKKKEKKLRERNMSELDINNLDKLRVVDLKKNLPN